MESRRVAMQAIFTELSEKNQDLMILIARSIKYAQQEGNVKSSSSKPPGSDIAGHPRFREKAT